MSTRPLDMLKILVPAMALAAQVTGAASQATPDLVTRRWAAKWIVAAGTDPFGFGVYHFRKALDLPERPQRFVVHVTADNRYQLWVNGARVVWGPARGDLNHWRYETVDLAPHLRAGRNVVAAVVWNYGELAPEAQTTWRTGFLIQGETAAEKGINSDETWKAARNPAYAPIPFTHAQIRGYYVVGPGERVEGAKYPWGWESADHDDSSWAAAQPAVPDGRANGSPRASQDAPNRWLLVAENDPAHGGAPRAPRLRPAGDRSECSGGLPDVGRRLHGPGADAGPPPPRRGAPDHRVPGAGVQRRRGRDHQDGLRGVAVLAEGQGRRQGEPERGRRKGVCRQLRPRRCRRRAAPAIQPALVAHLPVPRADDRHAGRAAGHRRPARHLHGVPVRTHGSRSTRARRSSPGSSTWAGARPGCARTRATWTARTTSNSSTPGTRGSRRSSRSTRPATRGS